LKLICIFSFLSQGTITPTNYTFFGPLELGNRSELQDSIVLPDPKTANDVYALINFIRKVQAQNALAVIVPSPPSVCMSSFSLCPFNQRTNEIGTE
jgi:hypothetical protein